MKTILLCLLATIVLLARDAQAASLFERLGLKKGKDSPALAAALSNDEIANGLKEALFKGVERAVGMLGKEDGFLRDAAVKIPMPQSFQKVERTLRTLGQDRLADDFLTTMNRAAERAVPEAASVLGQAVKQMTLDDAQAILRGTNNAATAYFQRTSTTNLHERFLPIVRQATEQVGVTGAYKKMTDRVSFGGFTAASLLGQDAGDLDGYITRKALDGLFLKIGEEEQRIRENPVARTTELLKRVFGAVR